MRSEFAEYYREMPYNRSFFENLLHNITNRFFRKKFEKLSLGSEEWHKYQQFVSNLSADTFDCQIRSMFYELTMKDNCKAGFYILPNCCLNFPKRIEIGENVFINRNVNIVARSNITIGNNVIIGPNTVINSGSHNYNNINKLIRTQGHKSLPIIIGNDVFIGGNVFILPGVVIGDGAVIGAGAVVTKSVGKFSVVAGVPAEEIRRRNYE